MRKVIKRYTIRVINKLELKMFNIGHITRYYLKEANIKKNSPSTPCGHVDRQFSQYLLFDLFHNIFVELS